MSLKQHPPQKNVHQWFCVLYSCYRHIGVRSPPKVGCNQVRPTSVSARLTSNQLRTFKNGRRVCVWFSPFIFLFTFPVIFPQTMWVPQLLSFCNITEFVCQGDTFGLLLAEIGKQSFFIFVSCFSVLHFFLNIWREFFFLSIQNKSCLMKYSHDSPP